MDVPTTPYHLISAVVPGLSFIRQAELYIIFAALMAVIATVSYTHLDVYKRQIYLYGLCKGRAAVADYYGHCHGAGTSFAVSFLSCL